LIPEEVHYMSIKPRILDGINLGYNFNVETNLHDDEAINALANIDIEFAQSLYMQAQEYQLSEKQIFWTHVLALESQGIKVRG
jgi:hypothetical protein